MGNVLLTLTVIEGDRGCRAEISELEIAFHAPTKAVAVRGLRVMLINHCQTLVARGNKSHASSAQMELAKQVVSQGFDFVGD